MPNQLSPDLLSQGLSLLIFGMGVVVVFLTLLVVATTLMSRLVLKFFPEPLAANTADESAVSGQQAGSLPDPLTLKIIQEAVRQHRHQSQK